LLCQGLGQGREGVLMTGVELLGRLGEEGRKWQQQRHQVGCLCQMQLKGGQGRPRGEEEKGL